MLRMLRLAILMIVMLAAACRGVEPPAGDDGSPPTQLERSMLGPDADNPYFLSRFRNCAAFGSYTYCQAEMYGGLPQ